MRSIVRDWLRGVGATEDVVEDLVLACGEACTNAVEHADGSGELLLRWHLLRGDLVKLSVRDFGHWSYRPADEARPGTRGRGLAIARQLVDHLAIRRYGNGTEIVLYRRLPSRRAVAA